MSLKISVVICTYNPKEEYLNIAIDAILKQDFNKEDFEFFIIDNNSSFKVSELKFVKENNIRIIEEKTPGLTAARECGARNSKGKIIVFVDDDNILNTDYLTNVEKLFDMYNYLGVVSGEILPIYEVEPPKWFYQFESAIAIRRLPNDYNYFTNIPIFNVFFPIGAGISIRRQLLISYFDDLTNNVRVEGRKGNSLSSGEDLDIDYFAISKGYLIGQTKKLSLKHLIPASRVNYKYINKLNLGSLKSTFLIKKKWENKFAICLFPFLCKKKYLYLIKAGLLFPFSFQKKYSIKMHNNINIAKLLNYK